MSYNSKHFVSSVDSVIIIIDLQEKLFKVIHEKERLLENLQRLIEGSQILGVPVLLTEQNPHGLGATTPAVKLLLPDIKPIVKYSFSCCGEKNFLENLNMTQRKNIVLTGIESHICVYQSCVDLLNLGYSVHVVTDCVSSRTRENQTLGIQCMSNAGAFLTGTEMLLFELLRTAESDKLKAISRIVK